MSPETEVAVRMSPGCALSILKASRTIAAINVTKPERPGGG